MDLYHSRLIQDDLNDLIIKYKIPRNLHPRLPFEEFLMSELSDDAIDFVQTRNPDIAIDDPRPVTGSFNMADVRRLSTHVVKLRDMPEGVLVLSGLSRLEKSLMSIHDFLCLLEWTGAEVQEEPHLDVRPTLQRLSFYFTPPAAADVVIPEPTPEDLAVGTPSSKIVAKAEATQKRKASIFFMVPRSSQVTLMMRVMVMMILVLRFRWLPFCSVDLIPLQEQGRDALCSYLPEGSNTQGKGIMLDDVVAPSGGVSQPRSSSGPASSFRDVSGDAIHTDFFPFSDGPYYATYPEDGVARNCGSSFHALNQATILEAERDEEILWLKAIKPQRIYVELGDLLEQPFPEQSDSLFPRVLSANVLARALYLASIEERETVRYLREVQDISRRQQRRGDEKCRVVVAAEKLTGIVSEKKRGLVQKFLALDEFSRVQGELLSLAASAGFERGLSMHQTEDEFADVLKKMVNFMPDVTEPLSVILQLELEKLAHPANVPTPRDTHAYPPIVKESTMTHVSQSLELSVMLSLPLLLLLRSGMRKSERISSSPTDVVVALFVDGKGDVLIPSSIAGEEAVINSFGV
ncbi:hypothetical protein Tco_0533018 [Tanacetum coccineum]